MSDPRFFRKGLIELGSGLLGERQWRLMYDPVGPVTPDENHAPAGPLVMLYVGDHGGGRPVELDPLTESLGPWTLVWDGHSNAHVFGKVAIGFDRVQVDCAKGPTIEAIVVECADHLPYNYYIGEVASRVTRVRATGPGSRTASVERDW